MPLAGRVPASKFCAVNHGQQWAAFETDNGRSPSAAGTPLHAPYLPFAIPVGNSSVGWILVLRRQRRFQTFPPSPHPGPPGVDPFPTFDPEHEIESPATPGLSERCFMVGVLERRHLVLLVLETPLHAVSCGRLPVAVGTNKATPFPDVELPPLTFSLTYLSTKRNCIKMTKIRMAPWGRKTLTQHFLVAVRRLAHRWFFRGSSMWECQA